MIYSYGTKSQSVAIFLAICNNEFRFVYIKLYNIDVKIKCYITATVVYSNQNYNDPPVYSQQQLKNATITSQFINIAKKLLFIVLMDLTLLKLI